MRSGENLFVVLLENTHHRSFGISKNIGDLRFVNFCLTRHIESLFDCLEEVFFHLWHVLFYELPHVFVALILLLAVVMHVCAVLWCCPVNGLREIYSVPHGNNHCQQENSLRVRLLRRSPSSIALAEYSPESH